MYSFEFLAACYVDKISSALLLKPVAAPAWDKWGARDRAFDHALFRCVKHFLQEETPLVSKIISFKRDHQDNEHNPPPPPPRRFFIRFARISRTNFLNKWGGPVPPITPVAPPLIEPLNVTAGASFQPAPSEGQVHRRLWVGGLSPP